MSERLSAISADEVSTDGHLPASSSLVARRRRQMRLVFGCFVGLATGFAGLFIGSLTIFLKPIAVDFGWNRTQISSAVVMSMLGLAFGSPIQGYLIDRIGARAVIGTSVVALAGCIAMLSVMPGSFVVFSTICLAIGAFGVATGPNGYLSLLPAWFDRRLGLALSTAMIGVGIGAACLAPLAQALVTHSGWRHAYQVLAAVSIGGGAAAFALIGVGPAPLSTPAAKTKASIPMEGLNFGEGLRDWHMWVLVAALVLGGGSGLGMVFHTAPMLDDRHINPEQIGVVVALSGVGLMVGRFVGGALMDIISARIVGGVTYLLGALAVALLGFDLTRAFPVLAFGGLLLGFAMGTEGDFAAFAVRRYFGKRAFGSLYGCAFTAFSLGSVAGVILLGTAYDVFGNYHVASAVCIGGYLVAAALAFSLGKYRYASHSAA